VGQELDLNSETGGGKGKEKEEGVCSGKEIRIGTGETLREFVDQKVGNITGEGGLGGFLGHKWSRRSGNRESRGTTQIRWQDRLRRKAEEGGVSRENWTKGWRRNKRQIPLPV